ncbi:MAG TPA: SIMPL domain-containing protein [Armatimonadota bacterium]|nr:SIMPL domain-containing protein [Armatimonadota bacterium]
MRIDGKVLGAFAIGIVLTAVLIGQWGCRDTALTPATAQVTDDGRPVFIISIQGNATVRVKPDSARIFFNVTKAATTPGDVRQQTVSATNDVMARLEKLGIEDLYTKTSTTSVDIVWDDHKNLVIEGYRMTTAFTVRVVDDNVERLGKNAGKVVDAALESGANEIERVTFFKEDDDGDRLECLKQAVADARSTAEAIAATAGVTIAGPVTISGVPSRHDFNMSNSMQVQSSAPTGGGGAVSSYAAGDLELACNTQATFEFNRG